MLTDRAGLFDTASVEALRKSLVEAFCWQVQRSHPMQADLASICLSKLPSLRIIGLTHDRTLDFYRLSASGNQSMSLPPLFAEIYDFPRKDDDDDASSGSPPVSDDCADVVGVRNGSMVPHEVCTNSNGAFYPDTLNGEVRKNGVMVGGILNGGLNGAKNIEDKTSNFHPYQNGVYSDKRKLINGDKHKNFNVMNTCVGNMADENKNDNSISSVLTVCNGEMNYEGKMVASVKPVVMHGEADGDSYLVEK